MSQANVVVKLKDEFSSAANRMENTNKGFNKSLEETQRQAQAYSKRLDAVIKRQAQLQSSVEEAKREMNRAKAAFKETGSAADSAALTAANEKYLKLKNTLSQTSRAAKDTQRALYDLEETRGKQAAGMQGGTSSGGGLLSQLGQAGAAGMVGDILSQAAGTFATSALGSAGGNMVSSALSSAGMGAAIGTAIAPGIGTAIGAALGSAAGVITAKMDEMAAKDDYYRDAVQSTLSEVQQGQAQSLKSGSTTAAQREQDAIAFNQLLGEGVGDQYLTDLRTLAAKTPMEYGDLTAMSRSLATGFGDDPGRMLGLMTSIGNAGSAVGIDAGGMNEIAKAMSRMQSSDKATLEYLNILQERGVNVIGMLADAYGKTQGEIYDGISKGLIRGTDAVAIIQDGMDRLYDGAMEKQSQTYEGLASTLADAQTELDNAMGEAYNASRKKGMQEQIDFLSGETGEQMQEAYGLIGEFQASLENKQEQLQRDAISSVMNGVLTGDWTEASDEYKAKMEELMSDYDKAKIEGDGAEMGRVIAAAQAMAQAEYTNSEGYQTQVEAQKMLIGDVQEAVAGSYWQSGYELAQEQSKGYAAGLGRLQDAYIQSHYFQDEYNKDSLRSEWSTYGAGARDGAGRYAYGLTRVPYNNYPALLHEGERVLTAAEARRGGSAVVNITGNQFTVREEADVDRIASAIASRVSDAMLTGGWA